MFNSWTSKSFLLVFIALFSVSNCESEDNFVIYKEIFNQGLLKELSKFVEQNSSQYDISQCVRDIKAWKSDFLKKLWPMKMLDSSGKIPPGLLTYNIQSYGQFDECLSIDHLYQNDRKIKGKYCVAKIPIPISDLISYSGYDEMNRIANMRKSLLNLDGSSNRMLNVDVYGRRSMIMAVCIPHTCQTDEIQEMLRKILESVIGDSIRPPITIPANECLTTEPPIWTSTDKGALAFFIFFGILLVLSTSYDLIVRHFKKDLQSSASHEVLISFSVWTNTSKLMTINNNVRSLKCLHGLRSLSLLWVILGHRYIASARLPTVNNDYYFKWFTDTASFAILSSRVSVDTFFVLSGLLVAYICFRQLERKKCFNFPLLYLHRFLRLTPALAAVIFFQVSLLKYTSNGPLWDILNKDMIVGCEKNWWKALLYVQNYVDPETMCISQTWYLSCDMQLFILSPIVIYPFLRWKRLGWANMVFWILFSQIGVFIIAYENEWYAASLSFKENSPNFNTHFYVPTHTRATPWLMGFAVGYAIYLSAKANVKINKVVVFVCWIASLATMGAVIFGMKNLQDINHTFSHAEDTMYNAFAKTGWSIAVLWVIIACTYGYGGPVNWFLSWEVWELLGRLSYSMYLIHGFVQSWQSNTLRQSVYFTTYNTVSVYFSDIVLTIFAAYLLTISFELPFIALEKILFNKKKPNVMKRKKTSIPADLEIQTIDVKN